MTPQRIKQYESAIVIIVSSSQHACCTSGSSRTFHSWPLFTLILDMFVVFALPRESNASTSRGAPLRGRFCASAFHYFLFLNP